MRIGKAVKTAINVYNAALKQRPYTTQIISSAALWGLGDALAQRIEKNKFQQDRWIFTTAYGGLFNGIIGHTWYMYLDRFARTVAPTGKAAFLSTKVVADCLVFGPVHIAAFFTALTLSEGGNVEDVKAKLCADALPTLAAELMVWPVIQVFNFAKVPLQYQLLLVNGVTIFDATFMSWAQHNDISGKIEALLGRRYR